MDYRQFRNYISRLEKYTGCRQLDRAPIINNCYPGAFNLSFGEYFIKNEFGKYQFFDHDFIYSSICSTFNNLII